MKKCIHALFRLLLADEIGDGMPALRFRVDEHGDQLEPITRHIMGTIDANPAMPELLEQVELLLSLQSCNM
jgi:hypothetical protein